MSWRAAIVVLALCGTACGSPQPQPKKIEMRAAKPIADNPPPPPKTEAEIQAATRPLMLGPAKDASLEDRRAAALRLLTDGITAEHLSLEVADPGVEFDPDLDRTLDLDHRPAQMWLGTPTVSGEGELDVTVIGRSARAHRDQLRSCYAEALKPSPNAQGRLVVEFEISRDGALERAKITERTIESEALEACVLDELARWKFPSPEAGTVKVSYPLTFAPK